MFAKIAIAAATFSIDRPYDYLIPDELRDFVVPGIRVLAPFGRGNRICEGIVLSVNESSSYENCKEITRVIDSFPLLSMEMLKLAFFMRERYYCTVYQAVRTMLPAALWLNKSGQRRGKDLYREMVRLLIPAEETRQTIEEKRRNAPKQADLLDLLCSFEALPVQDLLHFTGSSRQSLLRLVELGYVELYKLEVYRKPDNTPVVPATLPQLNEEQISVFHEIVKGIVSPDSASVHLISGVTGSGKTSIYAHLIDHCLKAGKSAILLVPEIALTPQILARFTSWFGDLAAVLHSGLSIGERYDEWKRIQRQEARLVIGTRSAVFAPISNLGLIIVDEEQEDSYRSESSPRYNAKEVARFRCYQAQATLILGSATPDIQSRYLASQGIYSFHQLRERYNSKPLPGVHIIDMKEELRAGNRSLLSIPLKQAIIDRISREEQSILFLNRRGTNKLVCCSECGYTYRCPHCSVSMTWHSRQKRLICHYCGSVKKLDSSCPKCGGVLNFIGAGTQLAEEELRSAFPEAGILRVDSDTVAQVGSHRALFRRFEEEKIPLMIGTQMIAKGLNFDNVTLVGVLSADQSLYSNDFKAGERTFSLLTQVIGRSGRGEKPGEAYIQTFTPDNEIINLAGKQDYESFYQQEIEMRRIQKAPPFYDWIAFTASGSDEAKTIDALCRCKSMLENSLTEADFIQIMGPVPLGIVKMNDQYRYRLQICCHSNARLRTILASVLSECANRKEMKHVHFYIDNDPSL